MGFFGGSSSDSSKPPSSTNTPSEFAPPSAPLSSPSPFSTTSPSSSSSSSSSETRQRIQSQIQQSANLSNARHLIAKVGETCFAHCVPNPGDSLSSKEQQCLSGCMEKYIESWNQVSRAYVGRLQREGAGLPLGGGSGGL